jgi:hypothetical protein
MTQPSVPQARQHPDPSSADRVEHVTPAELRARGGWSAMFARVLEVQGWYGYTEHPSGAKVLLLAKAAARRRRP